MAHTITINRITIGTFTPEQHARTCNYWYYLQYQGMSYKAWTERAHFLAFLDAVGLTLPEPLAEQGKHSWQSLEGCYKEASHMSYDDFYALESKAVKTLRWMDNGAYTLAYVTQEEDGTCTVNYLNCNMKHRQQFDYFESRAIVG